MRKTIFIYGITMATLIALLKWVEFRYFVRDFSIELYIGIVAVAFTAIGIWAGLRLTRKKVVVIKNFVQDESQLVRLGISKRELEVLELIASGLSNQEIADKLFVSINTVKSHSSNLFLKLEAGRRTQAIQKAKELRIIP